MRLWECESYSVLSQHRLMGIGWSFINAAILSLSKYALSTYSDIETYYMELWIYIFLKWISHEFQTE